MFIRKKLEGSDIHASLVSEEEHLLYVVCKHKVRQPEFEGVSASKIL